MKPSFYYMLPAAAFSRALPADPEEAFRLEGRISDLLQPDPFRGRCPTSDELVLEIVGCTIYHIHYRVLGCVIHLLALAQQ